MAKTFKREAVALLESADQPQVQIAAELGIQPSMLRQWRAAVKGAPPRSRAGVMRLPLRRPGGRDRSASS